MHEWHPLGEHGEITPTISGWAAIIRILGIIANFSGGWLLLRARDVLLIVDKPDNQIAVGANAASPHATRPSVS